MGRIIAAFSQFFDGNGDPVARGWLRFLESGSNNTDKTTFFDPTYQIPNPNPLQLDGEGRCPDVFGTGSYRVISFLNDPDEEDSPGEQIQMFDPVVAEGTTPTGGGAGSFEDWDIDAEYTLGDIVTYNTEYYRSLIVGNLGNNPSIEEYAWEKFDFLRFWNSTITYSINDLVFHGINLYLSKQSFNSGNDPASSPAWWRPVATGYHNVYVKSASYEILPTEFDSIFVLSSAAVADSQFDLPVLDATQDRFRVAIYNQSAYNLTLSALGTAAVWIDSTEDLILEPGAFQELFYFFDLDLWAPFNNSGQALGGQTLGTVTLPVAIINVDEIEATLLNVTRVNAGEIHIPSDQNLYFGDADQIDLNYNSGSTRFDIGVPAANDVGLLFDGDLHWLITSAGGIVPQAGNPASAIGALASPVAKIYATAVYIPTSGSLQFGPSTNFNMVFDGSDMYLVANSGTLNIGTSTANNVYLVVNGNNALRLGTTLNASIYGTTLNLLNSPAVINFGSPARLAVFHDGTHAYWDYTGNTYFRYGGSAALGLDTGRNVIFYNNTYLGTDETHYLGDSANSYLRYTAAYGLNLATVGALPLTFITSNTLRWAIDANGHFSPYTNNAFDIGWASGRVKDIYCYNISAVNDGGFDTLHSQYFIGYANLRLWCQNGGATSYAKFPPFTGSWNSPNRIEITNFIDMTPDDTKAIIIFSMAGNNYRIFADRF